MSSIFSKASTQRMGRIPGFLQFQQTNEICLLMITTSEHDLFNGKSKHMAYRLEPWEIVGNLTWAIAVAPKRFRGLQYPVVIVQSLTLSGGVKISPKRDRLDLSPGMEGGQSR